LVAELFGASGEDFVSVRRAAGEGEVAGAEEISFGEDFTGAGDFAASRDESRAESRLEEEAFGLAAREVSTSEG